MIAGGAPGIDLFTITRNLSAELYCGHVHDPPCRQAAFIAGWLLGYS